MNTKFKTLFILVLLTSIFSGCSAKKEEKIINYEKQQENSKEALKEL